MTMHAMHPAQMVAVHRAARGLSLFDVPGGAGIVEGDSETAVRDLAAAAAAVSELITVHGNATGRVLARMVRPVPIGGGRYRARVPRAFVQATPFLGWGGVRRITVTASSYERAVRVQNIMRMRFGPAPVALPVMLPNGRWAFNVPLEWARHLTPHMTAPVVLLRRMPRAVAVAGVAGVPANALGQFGEEDEFGDEDSIFCPDGFFRDLSTPSSPTFGQCVPLPGTDVGDDVAFECPAGSFFDEFTVQCKCSDPAQVYDASTNSCVLLTCPAGSHMEAGQCVKDGGGGETVPPIVPGKSPPPPTGDRELPTTTKKSNTGLYVAGAILAVAVVAGGAYLGKQAKKKGKRK